MGLPADSLSTLVLALAALVVLLVVLQVVTIALLVRHARSFRRFSDTANALAAEHDPSMLQELVPAPDQLAVVPPEDLIAVPEPEAMSESDDAQSAEIEDMPTAVAEHVTPTSAGPVDVVGEAVPPVVAEAETEDDVATSDAEALPVSKRTDRQPPPALSKRQFNEEDLTPVPRSFDFDPDAEPGAPAAEPIVPVFAGPVAPPVPVAQPAASVGVAFTDAPLQHRDAPSPLGHAPQYPTQQQPPAPQPMYQQFQQLPYPPQQAPQRALSAPHQEHAVPTTPPRMPPAIVPRDISPARPPSTARPSGSRPLAPPRAVPRSAEAVQKQHDAVFASIEEMAVSAVIDGGRPVPQVAQTLRVSTSLVAYWVAKSGRSRVR